MDVKGIITGDIIKSSTIQQEKRTLLLDAIRTLTEELKIRSVLQTELFRGDSFQIVVDNPVEALKIAVLIRAGLKSKTPKDIREPWDARISLGVGGISYEADKVVVSDGEAFRLSGRELDEIGKRRLTVKTRWEDVNAELKVSTAFADDIISGWSFAQAQVVYLTLLYQYAQKDIAAQLDKSSQNISKLLGAAKEHLIRNYLERYSVLITEKLHQ